MAIRKATLTKTISGTREYIYPKTSADLVKVSSLQDSSGNSLTTVQTALESISSDVRGKYGTNIKITSDANSATVKAYIDSKYDQIMGFTDGEGGRTISDAFDTLKEVDAYLTAHGSTVSNITGRLTSLESGKLNKPTAAIGSATKGIYFTANGTPTEMTYSVAKDVPSNAVFTDTNTHYASGTVVTNSATGKANTTSAISTNGSVYLNHIENDAVKNSHKISGSGATTVTADASGNIVISSTDNNTVYTHPTYTSKTSGLYKVTVDGTGHVSAATAVEKADITALGIPGSDTTYSNATTSAAGLMSSTDKSKLDGIASGANAYSHPETLTSAITTAGLYKVKVDKGGHITGTVAVGKSDITGLGIPGSDTTYSNATTSSAGLMSATDKSKLDGIASGANAYSHPTYTSKASGLYKVTVDGTGHVSAATAVEKADITALGIPGSDTNTTYTLSQDATDGHKITLTPSSGDPTTITIPDNNTTYSAATTNTAGLMSADDKAKLNGIASGANAYTHPETLTTAITTAGLYKVKVDKGGHITGATAVGKSDIIALGIPGSDTTYSNATTSAAGLMSADDKTKLNGIASGANAYSHPTYTSKTSGLYKVTVDSTGHVSSATAVAKSDITGLGIPAQDTTYSAATTSAAGLMSADDKTKLNGIASNANNYTHPTYTAKDSGFYKVAVDGTGHVSGVTAVSKADITALGIPGSDTNTHYASATVVTNGTTGKTNTTTALTNGNVYLNHIENSAVVNSHKISGSGATTVTSDASGNIIISSTDNNTTYNEATTSTAGLMSADDKTKLNGIASGANAYTHPSYTAKSSGLYKVTVDGTGHVSAATAVAKADITGLGIPAQDTTYSNLSASSGGTAVSLVTTGEKYTWNSKTSNTGTVTKVSTGAGLTGGDVTTTGTIKANLRSETKLTNDSAAATETSGRVYPVAVDKSGYLAVNVPWVDTHTITGVKGNAESSYRTGNVNLTPANLGAAPLASPALTGTPTAPTAAAGTSNTQIATTEFVMNAFTANDAMEYKGTIGSSGADVTALPASHNKGWTYKVATAGTYAGKACEIGDMIICSTTGTTANNDHWSVIQANIDGAVTGPASATDARIAVFNGTSGKVIKDSGYTIATSVPSGAVFTDTNTKVTSSANHYTPSTASGGSKSASASGATAAWGIDVVKGVSLDTDGKGHVTGISVTSGKIPGNPNTDRYVNSASFADDTTNSTTNPVKMTLTRAGSDTASVTASIPKVSSSSAGVAPKGTAVSSQSQSTKFLREDGSWAAPSYTTNTDASVTSSANHYTPATASGGSKSASASGATAAWGIDVVKGVSLDTDGKGHVTGISVTSGKIPANPTGYTNQNAFSNVKVGTTTIAADTITDTLEIAAGSNITLTPDATNDKLTITATDTTYSNATTSAAGLMSADDKTKLNGIASGANAYSHPTYTAKSSGLYKVTVDSTGHVSAASAVEKADIVALGIPGSDTNTHYASKTIINSSAESTSNTTTAINTNGSVYLNHVENGSVTGTHKISGSGATTVTADSSGNIVISSTDNNTVYTHPTYTSKTSGLYKVTVDGTGHVSATTAVSKSDITALGIPGSDTTYSNATTSAAGLMSADDKTKLNGIASGANAYSHPETLTSAITTAGLYKVKVDKGGHITGTTAVGKSDITALGIPGSDTTYSNATTSAAGLMSADDKTKLNGIASGANAYSHPTYTSKTSGLYKITVDGTGHVSGATAVEKADITALGIPGSDTNTHYASKTIINSSATSTSNTTTAINTNGSVYLNHIENGSVTGTHKISGSGATTVTADASGNIVISSTDNNTVYTHPTYTSKTSGLYKITVDGTGHVSGTTAVGKSDITALGIPGSDTDRYVNSASFADATSSSSSSPLKMTLTRAGSDSSTVTANLPKVSSSSAGVAPKGASVSSQSQSTKFLREDGTWAAPSYTTNTNTTYTFATGDSNGQIKVTPSGGTAQNVSVKGLGTAAYTSSTDYTPKSLRSGTTYSEWVHAIEQTLFNSSTGINYIESGHFEYHDPITDTYRDDFTFDKLLSNIGMFKDNGGPLSIYSGNDALEMLAANSGALSTIGHGFKGRVFLLNGNIFGAIIDRVYVMVQTNSSGNVYSNTIAFNALINSNVVGNPGEYNTYPYTFIENEYVQKIYYSSTSTGIDNVESLQPTTYLKASWEIGGSPGAYVNISLAGSASSSMANKYFFIRCPHKIFISGPYALFSREERNKLNGLVKYGTSAYTSGSTSLTTGSIYVQYS